MKGLLVVVEVLKTIICVLLFCEENHLLEAAEMMSMFHDIL